MCKSLFYPLFRWLTAYMNWAGLILYSDGSSTPPPDPDLVDAQVEATNTQTAAIQGMTEAASALTPYQIQEMEFGLMAAQTAYDDSRVDREYSLERRDELTSLQDQMISDASSYNTATKQDEMASKAIADVGLQTGIEQQSLMRNQSRMGVNPASGNTEALANQLGLSSASSKVAAANVARADARQEGYSLTDRAATALSGYPTFGINATSNSLSSGTSGIDTVNQTSAGIMSNYGAISNSAAQAGSTANSLYGAQLDAYGNAQQAAATEEAGMWSAVGAAAGTYGAFLLASDETIKEDREKVSPGLSLSMIRNVPDSESWRYKEDSHAADGGKKHVGPMAQDVRAAMGDDVAPGGKAIDLASMNGHMMNAIKALDKKVDKAISLAQAKTNRKG